MNPVFLTTFIDKWKSIKEICDVHMIYKQETFSVVKIPFNFEKTDESTTHESSSDQFLGIRISKDIIHSRKLEKFFGKSCISEGTLYFLPEESNVSIEGENIQRFDSFYEKSNYMLPYLDLEKIDLIKNENLMKLENTETNISGISDHHSYQKEIKVQNIVSITPQGGKTRPAVVKSNLKGKSKNSINIENEKESTSFLLRPLNRDTFSETGAECSKSNWLVNEQKPETSAEIQHIEISTSFPEEGELEKGPEDHQFAKRSNKIAECIKTSPVFKYFTKLSSKNRKRKLYQSECCSDSELLLEGKCIPTDLSLYLRAKKKPKDSEKVFSDNEDASYDILSIPEENSQKSSQNLCIFLEKYSRTSSRDENSSGSVDFSQVALQNNTERLIKSLISEEMLIALIVYYEFIRKSSSGNIRCSCCSLNFQISEFVNRFDVEKDAENQKDLLFDAEQDVFEDGCSSFDVSIPDFREKKLSKRLKTVFKKSIIIIDNLFLNTLNEKEGIYVVNILVNGKVYCRLNSKIVFNDESVRDPRLYFDERVWKNVKIILDDLIRNSRE